MKSSFKRIAATTLGLVASAFGAGGHGNVHVISKSEADLNNNPLSQPVKPGRTQRKAKKPDSQRQTRKNRRRAFAAGNMRAFA